MRFRKSIRLAPGVRINLSRSGVSTTLGGRGASVNIGKRGTRATVGLPGTGISFSQLLGGGSRRGGGGGTSNTGSTEAGGCAGMGCLGLFMLVVLGLCMDVDGPPPSSYPAATSSYSASTYSTAADTETREWFYIHDNLNVRAEPNKDATRIRTLRRGDYVQLGLKDVNGWARLYSSGATEGYVYRASKRVRRQAPTARSTTASSGGSRRSSGSSRRSSGGRGYHTGPRGGCYYINSSGNKQYVDRSNCR